MAFVSFAGMSDFYISVKAEISYPEPLTCIKKAY
jgi:hypothetical protein